ncbi:hypothetical protein JW968_04065 [Candidatus Woesearchaeota archaeon]|nr:hypothetical protein [Candidatus Woesearchaeota archaeon]
MDRRKFLIISGIMAASATAAVAETGLAGVIDSILGSNRFPARQTLGVCNEKDLHPVVSMSRSAAEQRMRHLASSQGLEEYWAFYRISDTDGILVDFGFSQTPAEAWVNTGLMARKASEIDRSGEDRSGEDRSRGDRSGGYPLKVTSYHLHTDRGVKGVWDSASYLAPSGFRKLDDVNFLICALPSARDMIANIETMGLMHRNSIPYESERVVCSKAVISYVPGNDMQRLYHGYGSEEQRESGFGKIAENALVEGITYHSLDKALKVYRDAGLLIHIREF